MAAKRSRSTRPRVASVSGATSTTWSAPATSSVADETISTPSTGLGASLRRIALTVMPKGSARTATAEPMPPIPSRARVLPSRVPSGLVGDVPPGRRLVDPRVGQALLERQHARHHPLGDGHRAQTTRVGEHPVGTDQVDRELVDAGADQVHPANAPRQRVGEVGHRGRGGEQDLTLDALVEVAVHRDRDDLDPCGDLGRKGDRLEATDVAEDAEHGSDATTPSRGEAGVPRCRAGAAGPPSTGAEAERPAERRPAGQRPGRGRGGRCTTGRRGRGHGATRRGRSGGGTGRRRSASGGAGSRRPGALGEVDHAALGLVGLEIGHDPGDVGVGGLGAAAGVTGVDQRPEITQQRVGRLARLALVHRLLALVHGVVDRVGDLVACFLDLVEETHALPSGGSFPPGTAARGVGSTVPKRRGGGYGRRTFSRRGCPRGC